MHWKSAVGARLRNQNLRTLTAARIVHLDVVLRSLLVLLARRLQVVRVRMGQRPHEQWQLLTCGRCGNMCNWRTHQEVHHQREWQGVGLDVRCKEAGMQGQSQEQKPCVQREGRNIHILK